MCECGEYNTPEHAANSCTDKMTDEERSIHTKEFEELFEKAKVDVGGDKQLNNYLLWTMFKIEDKKEKSAVIRKMITKMKTVISKLILKNEE
jgi:cell division protein YceG involved in septum cleavage